MLVLGGFRKFEKTAQVIIVMMFGIVHASECDDECGFSKSNHPR